MLPSIELEGQTKIHNAHVLILGLGGLGCAAAQYLAASGIGKLTLVDDDRVEKTNLQRQVLHFESALGCAKVISAKNTLSQINSEVQIDTLDRRLAQSELAELLKQVDVVADCTDNLSSRQQINQLCFEQKVPLVSGAAIRFEGQVASLSMQSGDPCYLCFSRFFTEQPQSCSETGVFSPTVGIIGSIQAAEVLKLICKTGEPLTGRLLCVDVQHMVFNSFRIVADPDCPVCGCPVT
ncbi:HesA/MoeB/ThiF family protein [Rheinheimera sp. MM224]|uniref:HesA/MoeB/ThiF family protein n=1 Tax=Rheinheimera sp. MM224 TaxID=3019969 RepID=UPI0024CA3ABB|nr:Molybdopterin-synthase adenylyltransferase [Rheinheimera sp. MM224]